MIKGSKIYKDSKNKIKTKNINKRTEHKTMKKMMTKAMLLTLATMCVTAGVVGTNVTTANAKVAFSQAWNDRADYKNRIKWLEDVVTNGIPITDYYYGEKIPTSEVIASMNHDGSYVISHDHSYKTVDLSKYESILCPVQDNRVPKKLGGFAVGYLSDGTKEIIYDDDGRDIMDFDTEGWNFSGEWDWQGYDRNGRDEAGFDRRGFWLDGCDRYGQRETTGQARTNNKMKDLEGNYLTGLHAMAYDDDDHLHYTGSSGYVYMEDEMQTIKYVTNGKTSNCSIIFANQNESYYRVTVTGLKNSKYVMPIPTKNHTTCGNEIDLDGSFKDYAYSRNGCILDRYNWTFTSVPVKNGKAVFYVQATDWDCWSGATLETRKKTNFSNIMWCFEKAEPARVHVVAEPITKAQLKSETYLSVPSTLKLSKNYDAKYITIKANEPVVVIMPHKKSDLVQHLYEGNVQKRVGKNGYVQIGFRGMTNFTNASVGNGTMTLKGIYSGRTMKVKIVNYSPIAHGKWK